MKKNSQNKKEREKLLIIYWQVFLKMYIVFFEDRIYLFVSLEGKQRVDTQ